jgi:hypothetical protein
MRHSMYGADHQTPPAYRSSLPNGYERVDIRILEWIRRVSQQIDSAAAVDAPSRIIKNPSLRRVLPHISHRTMFDLHSLEGWAMKGIHYGI